MKAVLKRPDEPVRVVDFDGSLEWMQAAVGGYVEMVRVDGLPDGCVFMVNEEGKLQGLRRNLFFGWDMLVGPALCVKFDSHGEIVGMDGMEIARVKAVISRGERCAAMGG